MDGKLRAWLLNSVHCFRDLGFFAQFPHLTDEGLADQIIAVELKRCGEDTGSVPFWELPEEDIALQPDERSGDPDEELFLWLNRPRPDRKDLILLAQDDSRIWWEDGERDIAPGYNEYVRAITAWSRISRGVFLPTDVREIWDKPEQWPDCKVEVAFSLDGLPRVLHPWDGYGWVDFGLLASINALMTPHGLQFEMWDTGDQTTCLVVLTAQEKERLITDREWQFEEIEAWGV